MYSFAYVEDDSNYEENYGRHHTCLCFSILKMIRVMKRIPEDIIHVLVSLYLWWFEYRSEYLKTSYMSSFLYLADNSDINGNTWSHHRCRCFSMSKVIWMLMWIPEDIIHVLVSVCRRWFEWRREYPKTTYMSTFLYLSLSPIHALVQVPILFIFTYST
jgi:hypothetical protein